MTNRTLHKRTILVLGLYSKWLTNRSGIYLSFEVFYIEESVNSEEKLKGKDEG